MKGARYRTGLTAWASLHFAQIGPAVRQQSHCAASCLVSAVSRSRRCCLNASALGNFIRTLVTCTTLILPLSGCAGKRHPIQPLPRDYTVPQQWARIGCVKSVESYHGMPVLECPDGLRMIHPKTGAQVEFVSWSEIRRGGK